MQIECDGVYFLFTFQRDEFNTVLYSMAQKYASVGMGFGEKMWVQSKYVDYVFFICYNGRVVEYGRIR